MKQIFPDIVCQITEGIRFLVCTIVTIFWIHGLAYAQVELKTKMPDLCFDCHKELEEARSDAHVHFLFKEGKCIVCHNSHVSNLKGLLVNDINSICMGCHDDIRKLVGDSVVHGALRDNNCAKCHFPHSGENAYLLVKPQKDLCLNCHDDLTRQFNRPEVCLPFRQGKCSSCHDSHASSIDSLLVSPPEKLCGKCHGPKCSINSVSIVSAVKDSDCTTCHSGHSSNDKGLLGPYGHSFFLDRKCSECHNPITAGGEITTKLEGRELCVSCHTASKSKYEYIDGDVHVKDAANPCTVCHDEHASNEKNLTKHESQLCMRCHESTEKSTAAMESTLRSAQCEPVRERKCFACHIPSHSSRPFDYRSDEIALCAGCHASQHKITHPLGTGVIDPRTGREVTCNSCHSMHSANADFMLTHDGKRALCIQCHKM